MGKACEYVCCRCGIAWAAWAVGRGQWAVGSGLWTVDCGGMDGDNAGARASSKVMQVATSPR